jgi:hypothetical protein
MSTPPPLPPSAPPPTHLPANLAVPTADDEHRRRRKLLVVWADAALAALLAAAVLTVFLLDRNASGSAANVAKKYAHRNSIFDPLQMPIAEVREFPKRQQWIGQFGGSDESEEAVVAGLAWLARHQGADGHWGPDCLHNAPEGRCNPGEPCGAHGMGGSDHWVAQTALAVLALQAAGHYDFNQNEHSARVRAGLDWLVAHQRADGAILDTAFGTSINASHVANDVNMYEHGMAAFALADACEMATSLDQEPNDRYRQAAQRAIQFIEYAQHADGGWRYTPERGLASDVSVSGWQVLAIKAAKRAGIVEMGHDCIERCTKFFKLCELGSNRTAYQPGNALSDATTGVGMLMHEFILDDQKGPFVQGGAKYLADEAERNWKSTVVKKKKKLEAGNRDFYTLYNCTLAMFQAGGDNWKRWNDVVRDQLVAMQETDASLCTYGSWEARGRWSPQGGRIYSTALAVLTLEVYYRYKSQAAGVYGKGLGIRD